MSVHPALIAHSSQFPRRHMVLADGVHGFVGYAASNMYVLEGPDSLVVIDTTESTGAATHVLADLRKVTQKPIETIIYTHSHRDHISGASVFAAETDPDILAWHTFKSDIVGEVAGPSKAILDRTRKQFGFGLEFPNERVNLGCGPGDRPVDGMGAGHLPPKTMISAPRTEMVLAGHRVELFHAPGETPDHMLVWMPDLKVLISGDNYYHSFPNLYPIRGSAYRDFAAWADTLDWMLTLKAEVLAPGHTLPVTGAADVVERVTDVRDAIRFVMCATADALNAGHSVDEAVAMISLPAALRNKPWLQEFYGRVAWAVRAYAVGTLGWFDGNPTNIERLSPKDEARNMIALAGSVQNVLQAAQASDDPQWTLELADRLIAAGEETEQATSLKVSALRVLADRTLNATARNFYLVCAKDLEETL